ncbi:hypothetical protein Afil01_20440 [Actinorhabdospora filicis]|uniref:HTH tetR-type domain-containing protein n=1 Tax=Actinorhabdospora filicis TaxID=1785913 RepID=A0A9W6SK16_9ACTN|nr:TetR/AcrR family transcriptional regulator [Actinorhabdospora filicis]GLZ77237.1 hypothetical protein Afil01_20440 [Actinorhabdospora filicis]
MSAHDIRAPHAGPPPGAPDPSGPPPTSAPPQPSASAPAPRGRGRASTEDTASRKRRQRADRHRAIIAAARELAETEGWEAVTTRRLAQRIEYSQPVLYSHFAGKEAILGAVAVEGFREMRDHLRAARLTAPSPGLVPDAVAGAYLDFAMANPALFEAMFTLPNGLAFGTPESPGELVEAFGEMVTAFGPLAADEDVETFVELAVSALHGQTVLGMAGRLRPRVREQRLAMLMRVLKHGDETTAAPVRADPRWSEGGRVTSIARPDAVPPRRDGSGERSG